jgi:hypothetical protein
MKKLGYMLLLLTLALSTDLKAQNAQELFRKNLSVFDDIEKGKSFSLNMIYESRAFLIDLTGIKYQMEKEFEMPIFPPKKTIKEWKNWFEKNKNNLYWDDSDKKVKLKKQ